jgi:Flp pilus assembly protein TadG
MAACGGAAVIEFALVAPMFLMLLFGSIEFGRLLWTQ